MGVMLRVNWARWGQTPEDLRRLAMSAPHARTRERALALYDIAHGSCATTVAERTGRHPQTVMEWVHTYDEHGPEALVYRRTGGRPPFAPGSRPASAKRCARPSAMPPLRL
jgi:transposase